MKIALAQINSVIGDFDANCDKMLDYCKKAAANQAELIVFPEMCLCGYPPMDLLDHDTFVHENLKALRRFQREIPAGIFALCGYIDRNTDGQGKSLLNCCAVVKDGELVHRQAKTLLPTYDVFDETRYFEPATESGVVQIGSYRIGIAICEDIFWDDGLGDGRVYAKDPVDALLDKGMTLLVVPSASPFYAGKARLRNEILSEIGNRAGIMTVYVNAVGGQDSLVFDGHSLVTDAGGKLVHQCVKFRECLDYIDTNKLPAPVDVRNDPAADRLAAMILGVSDYMKKTGFKKAHLGLSGGIDSALVTYIAVQALGKENVRVFGMPSRYSSEGSLSDSEALCQNLGIPWSVIPIEDCFASVTATLEEVFTGQKTDITEENIQARIRGLLMMAYSNKFNSLLLSTGNKSELAVGYCTLYGDMCGGLSVIGDLFKTEVFEVCHFINREKEIIPKNILTKPPSAELRPDQKDSDSLPDYGILDAILRRYVLENETAEQIIAAGFEEAVTRKVLRMVGIAEYKRRQGAVVIKVSTKAFGNGRRMPIARKLYEGDL